MIELIKPSSEYKSSFIEAVKELHGKGRSLDLDIQELENDLGALLLKFENEEKGINLPEGYVPATTLWLVDGGEYIGRISIRHCLTEDLAKLGGNIGYEIRPTKRKMGYGSKLLEMALPFVKQLGVHKALVTCDDDNMASWKIIEKNGGVLQDKIEVNSVLIRRYWIDLNNCYSKLIMNTDNNCKKRN